MLCVLPYNSVDILFYIKMGVMKLLYYTLFSYIAIHVVMAYNLGGEMLSTYKYKSFFIVSTKPYNVCEFHCIRRLLIRNQQTIIPIIGP